MTKTNFEFPHERDPLYRAATKLYAVVTSLKLQPGSRALRGRLESAACRIVVSIGESVDFSHLRAKRLAAAIEGCAKATMLLDCMLKSNFLDENAHGRALDELRAVSVGLEQLPPLRTERKPLEDDRLAHQEPDVLGRERVDDDDAPPYPPSPTDAAAPDDPPPEPLTRQ